VTDANGCTAFTGGVIDAPATFVTLAYSVIDVLCFGGDDGSITITPSGGTEPYYYNWGNQNDILMSEESETLSGLSIGQYLIRVIDANGCIHEEIIDVNEPPLLETSNTSIDVLCYGDTTGVIDATIWGGTPPYSSVWSNGQLSQDAHNLGAGWYYYEVRDDHDCAVSDSAEILEPMRLEVESQMIGHVTCVDQSDGSIDVSLIGGVEPYEYLWGDGSEENYVSNLEAGWYELIYTDANGCFDTIYYFVESSTNDCLNIPNTITPNGDLYNDTWILENIELYPNAEIVIFNKWGNELMRSAGEYTPWDGRVNGSPLPSEVYYYIILLHNDASNKYTGTLTIIR
jgi:gliding motility-associated-like protein